MKLELIGAFLATLTAALSAVRFYFVRKATTPRAPLHAVMVASIFGSLFFGLTSVFLNYPNFGLSGSAVFAFIVVGLLVLAGLSCMYEGIRRIGASRTSTITRGNMFIASLIGFLFLGETLKIMHLVGIILIFFGIMVVSYETAGKNSKSGFTLTSDIIFPLLAMVFFGIVAPIVKFYLSRRTPVTVGLAIASLSSLLVAVLFFKYSGLNPLGPFYVQERSLYIGAAIALTTLWGFFYLALSLSPVSVVMPLRGMGPLFVLFVSYFYLGRLEKITKILVGGVFLTVLGGLLIGISV